MPAIEKPAHWLDILRKAPPTPLPRGVPVVSASGACCVVTALSPCGTRFSHRGKYHDIGQPRICADWRPDLSDPQGFGYAWRLFVPFLRNKSTRAVSEFCQRIGTADGPGNWRKRWEAGETTDADRVDLAKALAEVMS
jgi:hypothetical protein